MPVYNRRFITRDTEATPNPQHLRVTGPRIPVQVALPSAVAKIIEEQEQPIPPAVAGFALIDTGASISAVDEDIVINLGLHPIDEIEVRTPAGKSIHKVFPVRFIFEGNPLPEVSLIFAVGCKLQPQGFVVLLGRDLLQSYIFIYNGVLATVSLSV